MKITKSFNLQRTILLGFSAMMLLGPGTVIADPPARAYEFHAFDVPAELGSFTSAFGINNAGVIVGNYAPPNFDIDGFVFERGVFTDVNVPGSVFEHGSLLSVNDKGVAVGVFIDAQTEVGHAYVRSPRGEITVLPDPAPDAVFTEALGINNPGAIVGFYVDADGIQHGFLRAAGVSTPYDYPDPDAVGTALTDINDRGQILGAWFGADGNSHGFLLQKDGTVPIAFPGAVRTRPNSINMRGQIVGSYRNADGILHGFLLENGEYRTLDYPGADDTALQAINDHGVIVGTYNDFSFGLVATPEN